MCLSDETKFTKYVFFLVFIDQYDYILDIIDKRFGDLRLGIVDLKTHHSKFKIYRTNTTSPVSVFFSPLSVRMVRM